MQVSAPYLKMDSMSSTWCEFCPPEVSTVGHLVADLEPVNAGPVRQAGKLIRPTACKKNVVKLGIVG